MSECYRWTHFPACPLSSLKVNNFEFLLWHLPEWVQEENSEGCTRRLHHELGPWAIAYCFMTPSHRNPTKQDMCHRSPLKVVTFNCFYYSTSNTPRMHKTKNSRMLSFAERNSIISSRLTQQHQSFLSHPISVAHRMLYFNHRLHTRPWLLEMNLNEVVELTALNTYIVWV